MPDSFYLLRSKERIHIPKDHCAEMIDVETTRGEFRAHYAGFFDPNYNDFSTMELRNMGKTAFLFRDGQQITSLDVYSLNAKPSMVYGEEKGSSYVQGNIFAKYFDPEK